MYVIAHWILICSSGNWSGWSRKNAWQAFMKSWPCCRFSSYFGRRAGLSSDRKWVVGRGAEGGWCANTARERRVKVSVIYFKVCDIFSWFSVSFTSRSASRSPVQKAEVAAGSWKSSEVKRWEGNSAGEANISSRRFEYFSVRKWEFGESEWVPVSFWFILFCCKGDYQVGSGSEPKI